MSGTGKTSARPGYYSISKEAKKFEGIGKTPAGKNKGSGFSRRAEIAASKSRGGGSSDEGNGRANRRILFAECP